MSFFISDTLKGRVTENSLLDDKKTYIESEADDPKLFVKIETSTGLIYEFDFLKIHKKNNFLEIDLEIPQTFKYLDHLFSSLVRIEIKNNILTLFNFDKSVNINNFTLEKQNERSCYLLKIVIDI